MQQGLPVRSAEQCLELWQPMDEFFFTLRAMTRHHQSLQENQKPISVISFMLMSIVFTVLKQ